MYNYWNLSDCNIEIVWYRFRIHLIQLYVASVQFIQMKLVGALQECYSLFGSNTMAIISNMVENAAALSTNISHAIFFRMHGGHHQSRLLYQHFFATYKYIINQTTVILVKHPIIKATFSTLIYYLWT